MRKKSLIVISIITMLLLANISMLTKNVYAETRTGSEGTINWSYDSDTEELVFSGSGELKQSVINHARDNNSIGKVKSIKIEGNITGLCEYLLYTLSEEVEEVEVLSNITEIKEGTFGYCKKLKSVKIPDSVTNIGYEAFKECESLTSINIPNSVTSIGHWAFFWCKSLTNVEIPGSVTSIGENAFTGCESLTSLEVPGSVNNIGRGAFASCKGLTSVKIQNGMKSIGDSMFAYCTSLTNVEIPDSVTSIGNYAFEECKGLTNIVIPNSVTSIGGYAFNDCTSLSKIIITNKDLNFENGQGGICNESNNTIYCKSNSNAIGHAETYNINYVIDDNGPTMNLTYDNQFINVEATDGEGVGLEKNAYSLDGENWQSDNKFKVEKDGKYTVYAKDLLGNIGKATITVDTTKPEINSIKVDGTKITVEATDALSGLAENAYSLDGKNWQKENVFNVTKNGEYTIYVKDNSGNINTGKATVNVPEEKPAEDKTPEKTEEKPTEEPTEPAKEPEKEPVVEPAKETEKEPAKVEETKNDTKTAKNNNGETSPQTGDAIKIIAGVLIIASIGLVAIAIKKKKM